MPKLIGLKEYLAENYEKSIFEEAFASKSLFDFHIHGNQILTAQISEVQKYDVELSPSNGEPVMLQKTDIKFVHSHEHLDQILKLLKYNEHVKKQKLEPIVTVKERKFVKNKSLFPLMKDREVMFFTLLEGEILRGVIASFSRYEITLHLKGGIPVVIFRHAVYDVRDKKNRCYLKHVQEKTKDWQKSSYFRDER